MFDTQTAQLKTVLARVPASAHPQLSPQDLAVALSVPTGNTAELWTRPTPDPGPVPGLTRPLDPAAKELLREAHRISRAERATHVGTEHLLAALVRTGPAEVQAWLTERGANPVAVNALLANLHGQPGAEPRPSRLGQRLLTTAVTVVVVVVVFVLCIWGP